MQCQQRRLADCTESTSGHWPILGDVMTSCAHLLAVAMVAV